MEIETELEKARVVHREGRIGEAAPVYERILRAQPDHPEALHLLGVAKLQTGDAKAAHQLLERAAALAPGHAKIQNNLGNALLSLGRAREAAGRFRVAAKCDPEFADAHYNLGNALGGIGKTGEAAAAYRAALRIDPGHGPASNNLGAIYQARGDLQAAADLYRTALDGAPQSVEFRTNLDAALKALHPVEAALGKPMEVSATPGSGIESDTEMMTAFLKAKKLHEQGKTRDAEQAYRNILERTPGHPEVSHYLGFVLLQTGRSAEAVPYLECSANASPDDPIAHDHLGLAYLASDQPGMALAEHRRAFELAPELPDVIANLAWTLDSAGSFVEAETFYRKTLEIAPVHFHALTNYCDMLHRLGRIRETIAMLQKAHDANPLAPEPLANLALWHNRLNETAEADAVTETLVRIAPDHPACPLLDGFRRMRQGKPDRAIELLRTAIHRREQSPLYVVMAWFELGRALDSTGRFSEAFEAIGKGKQAREKINGFSLYDLGVYRELLPNYRQWFHDSRLKAAPKTTVTQSKAPVFFVGFPRSGTTLMEQVLGAHPALVTTNENSPLEKIFLETEEIIGRPVDLPGDLEHLDRDDRKKLVARFQAAAGAVTGADPAEKRVIDKLPLNIIKLGPANWLFPDSRAVVALRDPRDVVLSCYMQWFQLNAAMIHLHDLENAALFYAQVMGLWLHYRSVLTMPWIEYRYEDLVDDFDGTVGRVLEFLGEGWDDSVRQYADRARKREIRTPSFRAVTEPIYTRSVSRWRNYETELEPVLPILEPFVKEFGYEPS